MKTNDFLELLETNAFTVEKELENYVNDKNDHGLCECMKYSLLSGGKRIRPFIVIEAYKLFAKDENIKKALPFACALEMIHTYSLIHDDMPCMDNDDLRRGKPTNHKVFGEAKALLTGDTLLTYAFEVLASNEYVSYKSIRNATLALARFSGFAGMAGGQMIDLSSGDNIKSFQELQYMHSLKTGALIKCACLLGYFAACDEPQEDVINNLCEFAEKIGIAFQIRDDILDKISDNATLGKAVGSDEKNGKATSLSFMSIDEAQRKVDELTNEAISIINTYYEDTMNKSLVELSKYMVGRKN